tara:strand:- start:272 stop:1462 length:1191 start_codon:yes stop_codon:yes gene_type:complete
MKNIYNVKINLENLSDGALSLFADDISYEDSEKIWLISSNNWELKEDDFKSLGFNKLFNYNSVSLQDKKLYRYPNLSLPRQKVDLIKEKFNCTIIRNSKKADIHITSLNFLSKLIGHGEWNTCIPFSSAFKVFKYFKDENLLSDCALNKIKSLIDDVPHDCMINFMLTPSYRYSGPSYKHSGYNQTIKTAGLVIRDKIYNEVSIKKDECLRRSFTLNKENQKDYIALLSSSVQVILDSDVCNIIDEGLAILETKEYDSIELMSKSQSIDDRSLALEMLANCNIDKSYDVVSGIYYWNYEWLKNTRNWNTVNVKAFRNRMKEYDGNHNDTSIRAFNDYIMLLDKNKKLTEYAVNKTKEKLYRTLLNRLVGENADVFKINLDSLFITKELTNKIISND